jgi:tellurite methyltransferase
MDVVNPYDEKYAGEEYYWGQEPSAICSRVIELLPPGPGVRPRLLDLGCGEGRNAVYFARHGYDVAGLDTSLPGLEKTRHFAESVGVQVETIHTDIITYDLTGTYDVLFSTGTLHYLPPEVRERRFGNYKTHTSPGGLHVFSVFVKKPWIPPAPDSEPTAHIFLSGELMGYYWDWEIVYTTEEVFDCTSSGAPHQHAVNRLIARRPR